MILISFVQYGLPKIQVQMLNLSHRVRTFAIRAKMTSRLIHRINQFLLPRKMNDALHNRQRRLWISQIEQAMLAENKVLPKESFGRGSRESTGTSQPADKISFMFLYIFFMWQCVVIPVQDFSTGTEVTIAYLQNNMNGLCSLKILGRWKPHHEGSMVHSK